MDTGRLKKLIEAVLFVSPEPVQPYQVKDALGIEDQEVIKAALDELMEKYKDPDSGIKMTQIGGGYRFSTAPELAGSLKKWFKKHRPRLSRASLETLSIIAYRQPLTRAEVEAIRGVNVEGALGTLLERGLVRIVGRKDTVGRPMLYGTTRVFLEHFGLNTLKELPVLSEFSELDLTAEEKERVEEGYGHKSTEKEDRQT